MTRIKERYKEDIILMIEEFQLVVLGVIKPGFPYVLNGGDQGKTGVGEMGVESRHYSKREYGKLTQ